MSVEDLTDCWLEDEVTYHLPEHEVLILFNNDAGAEAFHEWWNAVGKKQFEVWVSSGLLAQ